MKVINVQLFPWKFPLALISTPFHFDYLSVFKCLAFYTKRLISYGFFGLGNVCINIYLF